MQEAKTGAKGKPREMKGNKREMNGKKGAIVIGTEAGSSRNEIEGAGEGGRKQACKEHDRDMVACNLRGEGERER